MSARSRLSASHRRMLFEESGIGSRFEVRSGYQVYEVDAAGGTRSLAS